MASVLLTTALASWVISITADTDDANEWVSILAIVGATAVLVIDRLHRDQPIPPTDDGDPDDPVDRINPSPSGQHPADQAPLDESPPDWEAGRSEQARWRASAAVAE